MGFGQIWLCIPTGEGEPPNSHTQESWKTGCWLGESYRESPAGKPFPPTVKGKGNTGKGATNLTQKKSCFQGFPRSHTQKFILNNSSLQLLSYLFLKTAGKP